MGGGGKANRGELVEWLGWVLVIVGGLSLAWQLGMALLGLAVWCWESANEC